jgi:hypothetical protein
VTHSLSITNHICYLILLCAFVDYTVLPLLPTTFFIALRFVGHGLLELQFPSLFSTFAAFL